MKKRSSYLVATLQVDALSLSGKQIGNQHSIPVTELNNYFTIN